jgi:hypothetical protein
MIYTDGSRLPGPDAVDPDSPVLVSDVVRFDTEVRLHVLDKTVVAASRYAQSGQRCMGQWLLYRRPRRHTRGHPARIRPSQHRRWPRPTIPPPGTA